MVLLSVGAGLAAGAMAGTLMAVAVSCAVALATRLETHQRVMAGRLLTAALLALPGALVVVFAFNGGGFFPFAPALAALGLAFLLLLRILFAEDPFGGFSPLLGVAAGAFALYCGWSLLSLTWSHAPGRALVETDRALLYLLLLVLFGSLRRTDEHLRWMVRWLVLGIATVCLCALITRVLPHVWPITPNIVNNRLSYPITYWNSLGLLASMGCILALHLTSSLREPPPVRIAAAGALPMMATTLLFTFSRGSLAVVAVGVVLYALLGRPRGLLSGALAAAPATAVALLAAYHADLLATKTPTTVGAVSQGRHVAVVCGLCVAGAVVLRSICLPLDARLSAFSLSAPTRRASRLAIGASVAAAIAVLLVAGAPHRIQREYHDFVNTTAPAAGNNDLRQRLTDPSNNGRLAMWRVSLRQFHQSELHGAGAGTFALAWSTYRSPTDSSAQVVNAHSLYMENLGELGIVGLALVLVTLGAIVFGLARQLPRSGRSVYAAALAATVAWALEAGVDWQWQMPVVTAIVFSLGGLALAGRGEPVPRGATVGRAGAAIVCVAVGVLPLLVAVSQAHLDDGVDAFRQQDCRHAERSARAAASSLGARAEPYELLGYCAMDDGRARSAVADMRKSVERDPDNWRYRYDLAIARASAGQDPRPDLAWAKRLGPYQVLPDDAAALFPASSRRAWPRRAALAPLPDDLTPQ
jgi:hypothetical protein